MKLVIAQMKHETDTHSPLPTTLARYAAGAGTPPAGAQAVGIGAPVTLSPGGKLDMPSIGSKGQRRTVSGRVRLICDGRYRNHGPISRGDLDDMGPTRGGLKDLAAAGQVDPAIHQVSQILPVQSVTLVGPLPEAIQNTPTYAAAVGSALWGLFSWPWLVACGTGWGNGTCNATTTAQGRHEFGAHEGAHKSDIEGLSKKINDLSVKIDEMNKG